MYAAIIGALIIVAITGTVAVATNVISDTSEVTAQSAMTHHKKTAEKLLTTYNQTSYEIIIRNIGGEDVTISMFRFFDTNGIETRRAVMPDTHNRTFDGGLHPNNVAHLTSMPYSGDLRPYREVVIKEDVLGLVQGDLGLNQTYRGQILTTMGNTFEIATLPVGLPP